MLEGVKNTNLIERNDYGVVKKEGFDDKLIHFFCFLSVLLIGADKWGIDVGVNLRLDQIFLVIFTALLCLRGVYKLTTNYSVILFVVFSIISVLLAFNVLRGLIYLFSIIYNVVFIFYSIESYVKHYGLQKFVDVFRKTMYTQFVILLIQFFLKVVFKFELSFLPAYGEYFGIPRFNLWFYEPSYLSTYLVFWLMFATYNFILGNKINYLKDVLICLVMMVMTTSSTGFIGIALVLVLTYFMWLSKGISLKKVLFLVVVILGIIIASIVFSSIFKVFIARLFEGNLDAASGGRISLWAETFNVFLERPLFGTGPGNYGLYLGLDVGAVPSNVTLELLATLGIFATLAFYYLTFSLIKKSFKLNRKIKNQDTFILASLALSLAIFTIILQANQGYLRLYHWMFFGVVSGGIKYCRK